MNQRTNQARLGQLRDLCNEIAIGLRTVHEALDETENLPVTVYLVTATLARLGWLADRGILISGAGDEIPAVGDAETWLLGPGQSDFA